MFELNFPPVADGFVPAPAEDPLEAARALGLKDDEYASIVDTLGRVPSSAELGAYSVMWSEHCSYKSSKVHLKNLPSSGDRILVGPGENAGVVDVGGDWAVTFKIESHNHPSYVEPFQGAATGVGGIIRDILTMGARPIALMNPLRFGDPDTSTTQWVKDGVVHGISHYGNCVGIPNVGGEVVYDPSYQGNPLVNVFCAGLLKKDRIQLARAEQVGDIAVLIGQRTGRDGIGGASILASEEFDEGGIDETKRPNVQVGDPFAAKGVIEACLELYDADLLSGIQDMGAAGIVCSTSEMASAARMGMDVNLDLVNLREPDMEAWEIICSESQERMLALVKPERVETVIATCAKWGVDAVPIGKVVEGDRLRFWRNGVLEHDVPAASLAADGPVYHRPIEAWTHPNADIDVDADARTQSAELDTAAITAMAERVLASPNITVPSEVIEQYDAIVGHGTIAGPGGDAAVLRLQPTHVRGVAFSTDGNGRLCALDPLVGIRRVVAESTRNVACVGAEPVAATNCLNFGSPERPEIMGQFQDTITGLKEACVALGTPITGGNVSFYNQTGDAAIHPTPVMGIMGIIDDVHNARPSFAPESGISVVLIGDLRPADQALAGSEWDWVVNGRIAGRPADVDLDREIALQRLLRSSTAMLSAHDVSTGGLVTSLVEILRAQDPQRVANPRAALGLDVTVDVADEDRLAFWFGEAPTQVVVTTRDLDALTADVETAGLDLLVLGTTSESSRLVGPGLDLAL
ncbi:phosphoribosylformylglycinamidine synthase subunit PurL [Stomatohabitans albus]|uniref:phosphoribosylformylglycinamidine synthase subunit PurL n=1 Tax=Stomatohabitans albus TaxID=3110766 RepID=UPI00300CB200